MHKKDYVEPAVDIISLATIQETMQSASVNGTGSNLGNPNIIGGDWGDLFSE